LGLLEGRILTIARGTRQRAIKKKWKSKEKHFAVTGRSEMSKQGKKKENPERKET